MVRLVNIAARLGPGLVAASAVALVGRRRRALSADGALAAVGVGTTIIAAGGWSWGALLVVFFGTSSALSALDPAPGRIEPDVAARGSKRDAVQVLANGGIPAALALLSHHRHSTRLWPAFAGAVAAVTADTWATELGAFNPVPPRLITSGRPVPPGTSGGVSPLGTLAAAAGAVTIAATATLARGCQTSYAARSLFLTVASAGLSGSLADSLLGATLQAAYRCPVCGRPTERRRHCGAPTCLVRGYDRVTNDVVNAAASLTGALAGTATAALTAVSDPAPIPVTTGSSARTRGGVRRCGTDAA